MRRRKIESFTYIYNRDGTCSMWDCGQSGVVLAWDSFSPEEAHWFCLRHWKEYQYIFHKVAFEETRDLEEIVKEQQEQLEPQLKLSQKTPRPPRTFEEPEIHSVTCISCKATYTVVVTHRTQRIRKRCEHCQVKPKKEMIHAN